MVIQQSGIIYKERWSDAFEGEIVVAYDKLRERSKELSAEVVRFCSTLNKRKVDQSTVRQIWKAGTSVFANVNESHSAQGRNDFAAKLQVALKECRECDGWFELLRDTGYVSQEEYKLFHNRCVEIGRILSSSIRTARENEVKEQEERKVRFKKKQKENPESLEEERGAFCSKVLSGDIDFGKV